MPYFGGAAALGVPVGTNSLVLTLSEVYDVTGAATGLGAPPPGTKAFTVVDIYTVLTTGFSAR